MQIAGVIFQTGSNVKTPAMHNSPPCKDHIRE
ncbi:MAG: hypothetical protein ACLRMZ_20845 [Blautia marasmi]